jgi:Flp pilus assembly protein TadD
MNSWRSISLVALAALVLGCQDSGRPTVVATASGPNTELARQENDRAFALIQQGKHAEAEPILQRALAADVTFGPAHNNLGLVYFHFWMVGRDAGTDGKGSHSQGTAAAAPSLYDAAREFDYASRLMPYQPDPRNNLGLVFEETGKFREAVELYERARKLAPDNPEYIGNLARVRVKRGDRDDETRKLLEELTFKDPRPDWQDWARMMLFQLKPRTSLDAGPTTAPSIR